MQWHSSARNCGTRKILRWSGGSGRWGWERPTASKPQQDEAKPPKEQAPGKAEDAKPAKNEKQNEMKQNDEMNRNSEMKPGKEENRPQENKGGDHATRAAGQQGQKIPDDKFRSHFGRQHTSKGSRGFSMADTGSRWRIRGRRIGLIPTIATLITSMGNMC
jgi:hypothetical protein